MSDDDLRQRLTRVETQVAQLDRHTLRQTEALERLVQAEAARAARDDAFARTARQAAEEAHERSAWGRALAAWVPWLVTAIGWAVVLWVSANVNGGTP